MSRLLFICTILFSFLAHAERYVIYDNDPKTNVKAMAVQVMSTSGANTFEMLEHTDGFRINLEDEKAVEQFKKMYPGLKIEKDPAQLLGIPKDVEVQADSAHGMTCGKADKPDPDRRPFEIPPGVAKHGAPEAWKAGFKGEGIKVVVLDTGCDSQHVNLRENYKGCKSFVRGGNCQTDPHSHGTHVAGTAVAHSWKVDGKEYGIVGVAPEADLYCGQILDQSGRGGFSEFAEGINWAVDVVKADVINISAGGEVARIPDLLKQALDNARNKGVLVACAAGNSRKDARNFVPASHCTQAFSAVSRTLRWASFSNFGEVVDFAGVGVSVLSTMPGNKYGFKSGTSMASPQGAGSLALWKQARKAGKGSPKPCGIDIELDSSRQGFGLISAAECVGAKHPQL